MAIENETTNATITQLISATQGVHADSETLNKIVNGPAEGADSEVQLDTGATQITVARALSLVDSVEFLRVLQEHMQDTNNPHGIDTMKDAIFALQSSQTSGRIAYPTLALLEADLDHSQNTIAEVTNDPNSDNNRVYIKSGAPGTGMWVASPNDLSARVERLENGNNNHTGWQVVFVDSNDNIIATWDQRGRLETSFKEDSIDNDALYLVSNEQLNGIAWAFLDINDNVIAAQRENGDMIVGEHDFKLSLLNQLPQLIEDLNASNINSIGFYGDSTTAASTITQKVEAELGVVCNNHAISGSRSYEIAQHFLDRSVTEDIIVFFTGVNNISEDDMAQQNLYDINRMIADLPKGHKYIVLSTTVPSYATPGTDTNGRLLENEKLIKNIFSERSIMVREVMNDGWDYFGIELEEDFIQPDVGSNVQVTVNDTSSLLATTPIELGQQVFSDGGDKYTVVSIDSTTTMTLRLDEANVIPVGDTVENLQAGSTTYKKKIRIVKQDDLADYMNNVSPSSARTDFIHYNSVGSQIIADAITSKFYTLGWV